MKKVFFDIHHGSKCFGKIVIEVDEDNLFAHNFTELCSGSQGSSYIGTLLWRRKTSVGMYGGTKSTNKNGVPPVIDVCENDKKTIEKVICKEINAYVLDDTYSAFLLATKDNKHKSFSRIGKVVEGYELIKGKHGQEITLTISDCGVILDI